MRRISLSRVSKEYRKIIREYFHRVMKKKGLVGILLFGSVGRGKSLPRLGSDVDLIVIAEDLPSDMFERAKLIREIEEHPTIVQSIWMTPEEFEGHLTARAGHVLDAIHEGITIFDPTGFIDRKRREIKEELRRKGVKQIKGAWVWPLKRPGEKIEL